MNFDLLSAIIGAIAILAILLMWRTTVVDRARVRRGLRSWITRVKSDTQAAPPAELTDFSEQLRSLQAQITEYEAHAAEAAGRSDIAAAHTRFLQAILEHSAWQGTRTELLQRLLDHLRDSLRVSRLVFFDYLPELKGFRQALVSGAAPPSPLPLVIHPDEHPFFLRRLFTARGGIAFTSGDAEGLFLLQAMESGSAVLALLRKEGDLFGALAAFDDSIPPNLDKQRDIFSYYSDAISVLLQNLNIRESIHRRVADLELLHEINLQISSILEFDQILKFSVERVAHAFQTEIAMIELVEAESLLPMASFGLSLEFARNLGVLKFGESLSGKVAITGKPVRVENVLDDPDFKFKAQAEGAGIRSYLGVPILVTGKLIGVLSVMTKTRRAFTAHNADLLATISSSLGVFIEQANLYKQLQAKLAELEQTRQQLGGYTQELEVANRELMTLNRLRSEFVSSVTHELRTPLTVVKGYGSMLASGNFGDLPADQLRVLGVMEHQIGEVDRIIRDLLDVSRVESGNLDIHPEVNNPRSLLKEIVADYIPLAGIKGIQLVPTIDEVASVCSFDPVRLRQVVRNLLDNAIKFTPSGGRIEIRSAVIRRSLLPDSVNTHLPEPEYWVVSVSDTGIGIPPAEIERIFDRYYQVHSLKRDPETSGAGIGLYLTRHIVEAHNGAIWVESKLKSGSRFSFAFPVEAREAESLEGPALPSAVGGRRSFLFIQPEAAGAPDDHLAADGPDWFKTPDHFGLVVFRSRGWEAALRDAATHMPDFILSFAPFSASSLSFYTRLILDPALRRIPFLVCPPGSLKPRSRVLLLDSEDSFEQVPADWEIKTAHSLAELTEVETIERDIGWVGFLNFPLSPEVIGPLARLHSAGAMLVLSGLSRFRETVQFMQSLSSYKEAAS